MAGFVVRHGSGFWRWLGGWRCGCVWCLVLLVAGCYGRSVVPLTATNSSLDTRSIVAAELGGIDFIQPQPLFFHEVIRPGDRVLFVGDELTQQMFYTRAIAAAVLALKPQADLRFFNGGFESATAGSALGWIDDLLELADPTVVFMCLGRNDAESQEVGSPMTQTYRQNLHTLIDRVVRLTGPGEPRRVIVVSVPAAEVPPMAANPTGPNAVRYGLALAAQQAAQDKQVGFVDLFVPMYRVYSQTVKHTDRSHRLTYDGRLPTEAAHVVMASVILYGIGVTVDQMEPIGWSPLLPLKMRRIRQALGLPLPAVPPDKARRSRELYQSMLAFDQSFFRAWRLAPRQVNGPSRVSVMAEAENRWAQVDQFAGQYR